jgi:hypothetical protein
LLWYCKNRPKAVIDGKTYPQCGNTCDKAKAAKLALSMFQVSTLRINVDLVNNRSLSPETAATSWRIMDPGKSHLCSMASLTCQSPADISALNPFLIEIPPGHFTFERGTSSLFSAPAK